MSFFGKKKLKLGERQKRKISLEFNIFFDTKGSGKLTWDDMEKLESHILSVSGWQPDGAWWRDCQEFLKELYQLLLSVSPSKNAQHITVDDWLEIWTSALKDKQDHEKQVSKVSKKSTPPKTKSSANTSEVNDKTAKSQGPETGKNSEHVKEDKGAENGTRTAAAAAAEASPSITEQQSAKNGETAAEEESDDAAIVELPEYFPSWTRKYFEYKFKLFDRSIDGCIDPEEFEYVLWDGFGVSPSDCREAFKIMTQDKEQTIDKRLFLDLFVEYFFSDEAKSTGNYLNGRLAE